MKISVQSTNPQQGNIVIGLLIGAVLALIPSYYFYTKYQTTLKLLKNPKQVAQEQTKDTVTKVGKLIALPKDETPTIATVQDKKKLKDQAFFKSAENGDKLLIYIKAKKAILYRDSTNKIIDVAPINISKGQTGQGANTQNVSGTPAPTKAVVTPTTTRTIPSPTTTQ